MLDFGSQTRLALAWSDAASRNMNAAMELGVSGFGAAVDFWSRAGGVAPLARPASSRVKPWYRAPETTTAFDPMAAWFAMFQPPRPMTSLAPFAWAPSPAAMFTNPMLFSPWAGPPSSQMSPLQGGSAAVPALMALVAFGAAAQQMLAMIEAQRSWQPASPAARHSLLPVYRSDGGHAVAGIAMPQAVSAAVTAPLNGVTMMLRMMQGFGPH